VIHYTLDVGSLGSEIYRTFPPFNQVMLTNISSDAPEISAAAPLKKKKKKNPNVVLFLKFRTRLFVFFLCFFSFVYTFDACAHHSSNSSLFGQGKRVAIFQRR
jgi:hypothetical protein